MRIMNGTQKGQSFKISFLAVRHPVNLRVSPQAKIIRPGNRCLSIYFGPYTNNLPETQLTRGTLWLRVGWAKAQGHPLRWYIRSSLYLGVEVHLVIFIWCLSTLRRSFLSLGLTLYLRSCRLLHDRQYLRLGKEFVW